MLSKKKTSGEQPISCNSCFQIAAGFQILYLLCTTRHDEETSRYFKSVTLFTTRHGVIIIDYNRLQFLSNRNRLNWPKMKCNRDRLHCQFNRNRRLLSRLNLEIFTLHHCAMNRGCGSWVSSFIIIYYGYVAWEAIYPCAIKIQIVQGRYCICS